MKINFKPSLIIVFLVSSATFGIAQETLTINKSIHHQKIDGFGALLQESYSWEPTTRPISQSILDASINELGFTIFRHIIDGSFEAENDNNNPNVADNSKFITGLLPSRFGGCAGNAHQRLDIMATNFKNAETMIKNNGDTLKVYATVFSPPAWMKYTKCIWGTDGAWNRLATLEEDVLKGGTNGVDGVKDFKDEFAEFCLTYLKTMENLGVKVDVLSIQNEPVFPQTYSSCVYSPESYFAVFKTVGQRLRKEGLKTKMMFTEDIGDLGRYNQFVRPITVDPVTSTFADIAAVHAYASNGVSPGSTDARTWVSLNTVSRQRSPANAPRKFWQTETSGYADNYAGAIDLGISIYTGLKYGKTNGWCFHGLTHPTAVEGLILDGGRKTDRYYAMKHFSRYIRPGAHQVESASTADDLLVTAFQEDKTRKLTIVIINHNTTKGYSFKLNPSVATGFPTSFTKYVSTSSSQLCQGTGTENSNATIQIAPNSIMTLVGENSLPEAPTSNEEAETTSLKYSVFPNPSGEEGFYILRKDMLSGERINVRISNLQGQELMSVPFENNGKEQLISTNNLTNGVYLVQFNNEYHKIIINK